MPSTPPWSQPPSLELDNPLWRRALHWWRDPQFESQALALQAAGWRVSHLLVAIWLGEAGRAWDGDEPETVSQWRRHYTERVRTLRQQLAREDQTLASLRRKLADAELECEKVELALWYRALAPLNRGAANGSLIRQNLLLAAPVGGLDDATESRLEALAVRAEQAGSD